MSFWWGAIKAMLHCWRLQERALRIISRGCTPPPQLPSRQSSREQAALQLVKETTPAQHPLHDLLPKTRADSISRRLQSSNNLTHIQCRANTLKAATLPTAVRQYKTEMNKRWIIEVFGVDALFCFT